jgi:hypothetical protein
VTIDPPFPEKEQISVSQTIVFAGAVSSRQKAFQLLDGDRLTIKLQMATHNRNCALRSVKDMRAAHSVANEQKIVISRC